jgi:hypothetical protein
MNMKARLKEPTDLQVVAELLRAARAADAKHGKGSIGDDVHIDPKDFTRIAETLRIRPKDLTARLEYHLNTVYCTKHGGKGHLTRHTALDGLHVNLARAAALYANLQAEDTRQSWTQRTAVAALVVSIVSLVFSVFKPSDLVRAEGAQAASQQSTAVNPTASPKVSSQPPAKP